MKKLFSVLLSALLLSTLVACGANKAPSAPSQQPSAPASNVPDSEPEVEIPLEPAYLTGLEKTPEYPEGKRITAVMVNNIAPSRPTRGLSQAQIVTEIKVEGGITRFMALYEDYEKIPEVGPIRSARDQFFQLLIPSWGFYVHDGPSQNQPTNWMIRDYNYQEFDIQPGFYDSAFWRDQARDNAGYPTEYTEYTDGKHIASAIQGLKLDDYRSYGSPMFLFHPYNQEPRVPSDGQAQEVAVVHSQSYRSLFQYDAASSLYKMSQFNAGNGNIELTLDENNGQQLEFTNLLVLFAPMNLYPDPAQKGSGLMEVHYEHGGVGYLFTQGGYEMIFWRKGGPDSPLHLLSGDKTEQPVSLNPGKSYIAVVDDMELEQFHTNLLAGTAQQHAEEGIVVSDQQEIDD